jgi:aminobenzoyl-glutamate transport protein
MEDMGAEVRDARGGIAVTGSAVRSRLLDRVERIGNALPDPVIIFVALIGVLMLLSAVGASLGWSARNPVDGEILVVRSLLGEDMVRRLIVDMPVTYAGFPVLGMVMLVMLGAGVADRSGLLNALTQAALRGVPMRLLTPAVMLIGMLSTHSGDTGYLVYLPLAGMVFAAAGRHPVLGIAAAFAGVGVGLAGNLLPGQYDVMLLGITQTGAHLLDPSRPMNPLGNWWFSIAVAVVFTALGWWIAERVVAPRLRHWQPPAGAQPGGSATAAGEGPTAAQQRRGLRAAGIAAVAVILATTALTLWPGYSPLRDDSDPARDPFLPFYDGLVAGFFVLFLATGWAYGSRAGTIRSHRDVVRMMAGGLEGMAPYLVIVFFAAQFVALFRWSNLGPLTAIAGAEQLRALGAPPAILLPLLTTLSSWLDFLISSGSAKWTAMAPVATPMLMLLGISPEMTTAAYRIGDTVTNLVSPLNPYFVLTLTYCQRWVPEFRLGTLLSVMLPFSLAFYLGGALLTALWVVLDLPVGPGAAVAYRLPGAPH